jgi:geranylgeranyl diphosphate synthase type II
LADETTGDSASGRSEIDAALGRFLKTDEGCPAQLAEAMRYAVLGPGKRLRPRLVLLAAEACSGSIDEAMPAACAVEMVHAYSLVHDDLPAMDDDDLRRGRATCHKVFGEATAILVGDALLARAFELLAGEVQMPERAARCCAVLARAAGATALVGGQADDCTTPPLAPPHQGEGNVKKLESIHRRKTGALIVASLELGGIVAGASDAELEPLHEYGRHLGLAFQITDDLLDVSGNSATVGKGVAKDAASGKMTFPGLLGVEESRQRARELVSQAVAALAPFGDRGHGLAAVARFVLERNQ